MELIDIRLLNTIIRKKESLSKGIKKVISIRIWMRSNKKQSFVNVVRRLCSSIFKINMGSKNSNATTHLPTLPGNMISAFLITLKTKITLWDRAWRSASGRSERIDKDETQGWHSDPVWIICSNFLLFPISFLSVFTKQDDRRFSTMSYWCPVYVRRDAK